jgi:CubicO group peptidase (beta-lactamase class C family)
MTALLLACTAPAPGTSLPLDPEDTGTVDTADSGTPADTGDPEDIVSTEDKDAIQKALQRAMRTSYASGAQLAIWKDGAIIFTATAGSAHPDEDIPVTDDTLFQVGSDTKKMVAITALQQVAAGRLSLDDTVADVLPGFDLARSPGWAEDATVHRLLSHQGGLFDYTPWDEAPADEVLVDRSWGVLATDSWAHAPPGAMWNYANPNFSLAGLLVQAADGRAWPDIVVNDVFGPLGMDHSYARRDDFDPDGDVARGFGVYDFSDDPLDLTDEPSYAWGTVELEDHVDNGFTRPAGLVWSTASDMARLAGFLVDGNDTLLPGELRERVSTGHVRLYPGWAGQEYGYGLIISQGFNLAADEYYDELLWSHGGNTLSQTSTTFILPGQRFAVQIQSNGYGDDMSGPAIEAMQRLAGLGDPVEPPPDDTTETDHALLTGTYQDPGVGEIVVTEESGALVLSIPYLESLGAYEAGPLVFALADVYVQEDAGIDITFIADEDGGYAWARNRAFVGTRVEGAAGPPPLATPAQAVAALDRARLRLAPLPGRPPWR